MVAPDDANGNPVTAGQRYLVTGVARHVDTVNTVAQIVAQGFAARVGSGDAFKVSDIATPTYVASVLLAHTGASDPHTQYQREFEKGLAGGYPSLNGSAKVVEDPANATATPTASKIPIANGSGKLDSWVTADVTTGGSQALTNKNLASTTNNLGDIAGCKGRLLNLTIDTENFGAAVTSENMFLGGHYTTGGGFPMWYAHDALRIIRIVVAAKHYSGAGVANWTLYPIVNGAYTTNVSFSMLVNGGTDNVTGANLNIAVPNLGSLWFYCDGPAVNILQVRANVILATGP